MPLLLLLLPPAPPPRPPPTRPPTHTDRHGRHGGHGVHPRRRARDAQGAQVGGRGAVGGRAGGCWGGRGRCEARRARGCGRGRRAGGVRAMLRMLAGAHHGPHRRSRLPCYDRLPACVQGGGGAPAGVHSGHFLRQAARLLAWLRPDRCCRLQPQAVPRHACAGWRARLAHTYTLNTPLPSRALHGLPGWLKPPCPSHRNIYKQSTCRLLPLPVPRVLSRPPAAPPPPACPLARLPACAAHLAWRRRPPAAPHRSTPPRVRCPGCRPSSGGARLYS